MSALNFPNSNLTTGTTYTGDNGVVYTYDGVKWIGSTETNDGPIVANELRGSAYGDDSILLIDSTNRLFFGNVEGDVEGDVTGNVRGNLTGNVTADTVNAKFLNVVNNIPSGGFAALSGVANGFSGPNFSFYAQRGLTSAPLPLNPGDSIVDINGTGYDGAGYRPTAVIKLGADKYSTISSGVLPGRIVFLTFNESGTTGLSNAMVFNRFGNLGIKKDDPAEALDVSGNGAFSGFVQFGRLTTIARDALSAANGMVIYNITDNKFQGYQNNAWINLDDGTPA